MFPVCTGIYRPQNPEGFLTIPCSLYAQGYTALMNTWNNPTTMFPVCTGIYRFLSCSAAILEACSLYAQGYTEKLNEILDNHAMFPVCTGIYRRSATRTIGGIYVPCMHRDIPALLIMLMLDCTCSLYAQGYTIIF